MDLNKKSKTAVHKRSISTHLTIILTIAIGVISIIVISIMHYYRIQAAQKNLESRADELYTYLTGVLEKSLWDIDANNIVVIGETINQNELVSKLIIKDSFGTIIYESAHKQKSGSIIRFGDVYYHSTPVGYVELWLTERLYNDSSRQMLLSSLITLIISLMVLIFITGYLVRLFLRDPILSLNEILDAYSSGNYDYQHTEVPYLEFQPFGRVLRQMGQKIILQLTEVKKAEEKYRNIFENAVEGIFQSTISGQFLSANLSMAKIYGYDTPEELISSVSDIGTQCYVNNRDRDEFIRRITQDDGVIQGFEAQMIRRDRSTCWVSISARLVKSGEGEILYYEGFCVDITNQKNLEAKLFQAQKMEAIGTLAGGIAHDFNNILGVIIGCTELLIEKIPDGSDNAILLSKVVGAGRRAKDLVKQILTFSRQEKSEIQPIYLGSIVKETLKFIRTTTPVTIDIEYHIDEASGAAMADPTLVHRLIMNLCTNAIQAMPPEGGLLKVDLMEKDLTNDDVADIPGLSPGPFVELSIFDTGHGISQKNLHRIFDPFFTTKPVGEGTGLGLSVVHGIVKKHKGGIFVKSQIEKGTHFKVYFPGLNTKDIKITPELLGPAPKGKERILIVDDEYELLDTLKFILEELGYQITAATDSLQAFDIFQSNPDLFDVVISDLTMPNMTGLELAKKIHEITPDFPTILCTGFNERLTPEVLSEAGVCKMLLKPVSRWMLANTLRQVLERKESGIEESTTSNE